MNHLSNEKSPYLLQHADNPVDWYPWCDDAFEKAKKEDKPVFLSIGYSTCHWCHVMETESFEDEEVAGLMNDAFISIKVDREERPDIDGIYMTVCQLLTGSGGWPLTIVMTPDKEPFFAGTYFPKSSRFGRPGMTELILQLKEFWLHKREEVNRSAADIIEELKKSESSGVNEIDKNIFEKSFNDFRNRFDSQYGGFGIAPKFPSPHNLFFLLRYYKIAGAADALIMVEKTLSEMRKGGIFDHIGYGFHRYSTDREWLVPHFEKMLYDQALLVIAYTETYQITRKQMYKQTAEEILEYVYRDMTSPDGGFYSAEDADSEGVEGKFYLWSKEEIKNILEDDASLISKLFNIKDTGNMPEEESGNNIFHLTKSFREFAQENVHQEDFIIEKISSAREKLFEVRNKRIHPFKDNKILTDWNGLMISAYAKASQVFQNKIYRETAEKAADFILRKLRDQDGKLLHRYREGQAAIPANLDDYSFFVNGLIDLYEATFDLTWLETAIELNEDMIKHFWDNEKGGFFFSPDYGEKLIVRQKEIYDGGVPSGNSVAILNLLRLGRITGDSSLEDKALKIANAFSNQINRIPSAFSQTLTSLDFVYNGSFEIIISGERDDKSTREIINYFRMEFLPNKIILLKEPSDDKLKRIAPFTEFQTQLGSKTTIYICRNYVCERPVTSLEDVKRILK